MILNTFANTDLPKTLVFFLFYISFALIIPYKTINLIKLKMYNMHVRSKLYDTNILKTLVFLSIISFRRVIFLIILSLDQPVYSYHDTICAKF